MKRVATPEYTYEGLLSLYTRLDKSYTIFLQHHILKSSYSFWIFIRQIVMHSKVKEYCTGLRKQSQFTYNNKILNLYSRSGNRGPSVWSRIPKSSVHCYPSMVRCATFIQAAGLQRLHANTSQRYFFVLFFNSSASKEREDAPWSPAACHSPLRTGRPVYLLSGCAEEGVGRHRRVNI